MGWVKKMLIVPNIPYLRTSDQHGTAESGHTEQNAEQGSPELSLTKAKEVHQMQE